MRNIYAFTEAGVSNPAYISLNINDQGKISMLVRSTGAQIPSECPLDSIEMLKFTSALIEWAKGNK